MADPVTDADGQTEPAVRPVSPPIPPVVFERLVNPLMTMLLRSPLHFLVSDPLLLVTFTGRKSGREHTTPVGYEQRDGALYVTTQTDRVWWRNLRGGAEVTVRLGGERRRGRAEAIEDDGAVAEYVHGYLERHGLDAASRIALAVDADEMPDVETLRRGLSEVVVVRIELAE
jgi:deazaflavin-dependent oxidoreductase (nitroreductase family)